MIIVEFTVDHPVLREPLSTVSDIKAEWEQTFEQPDGTVQMLVWIESDDFVAVERAVGNDQGVTNPRVVSDLGRRRLYRFDLTEHGQATAIYPKIVNVGGVHQKTVGTTEGWRIRIQFPDRCALEEISQFCRDHNIGFELHQIFEQTEWPEGSAYSLTDAQREILIGAHDSGYLDIPRECTLAELGRQLGVSQTAASERFRRGVKRLVAQTLK